MLFVGCLRPWPCPALRSAAWAYRFLLLLLYSALALRVSLIGTVSVTTLRFVDKPVRLCITHGVFHDLVPHQPCGKPQHPIPLLRREPPRHYHAILQRCPCLLPNLRRNACHVVGPGMIQQPLIRQNPDSSAYSARLQAIAKSLPRAPPAPRDLSPIRSSLAVRVAK